MAKYEVITIAIAVKNNRIARFGETVDDSELTVNGNALVEAGSLKLIEADTIEVEAKTVETTTEEVDAIDVNVVVEEVVVETTTKEVDAPKKAPTASEKALKK
jgi:hypothetical protein